MSSRTHMRFVCSFSALLVSSLLLGCGSGWQAKTYPAQGSLTINDEPAHGAVVTLYPVGEKIESRNSRPWGIVQQDGTFELTTYSRGDGAPTGTYAVTVRWPKGLSNPSDAIADRLGGNFARPEKSSWRVEVASGENELDPIQIDDVSLVEADEVSVDRTPMPGGIGG